MSMTALARRVQDLRPTWPLLKYIKTDEIVMNGVRSLSIPCFSLSSKGLYSHTSTPFPNPLLVSLYPLVKPVSSRQPPSSFTTRHSLRNGNHNNLECETQTQTPLKSRPRASKNARAPSMPCRLRATAGSTATTKPSTMRSCTRRGTTRSREK